MMNNHRIHIEITYYKAKKAVSVDMFGCKELNIPYQSAFIGERNICGDYISYWISGNIIMMKGLVRKVITDDNIYDSIEFYQTQQYLD